MGFAAHGSRGYERVVPPDEVDKFMGIGIGCWIMDWIPGIFWLIGYYLIVSLGYMLFLAVGLGLLACLFMLIEMLIPNALSRRHL